MKILLNLFFWKKLIQNASLNQTFTSSAALAFYLLFATFPGLIVLLSIIPFVPVEGLEAIITNIIRDEFPGNTGLALSEILQETLSSKKPGLLSIGFLGALWASTSGMSSVIEQLNIAYNVKKADGLIKVRLKALALTIFYGFFIILGASIMVFAKILAASLSPTIVTAWMVTMGGYIVAACALMFGFASLYYYAPKGKRKFKYINDIPQMNN